MDFNRLLIQEAETRLQSSRCGFITSQYLSELVDQTLTAAFQAKTVDVPLALVAVGGYGRREIAPFSDIDIMLLTDKRDGQVTATAEKALYAFWDIGIHISHSFRTIDEGIEDSLSDLQTRTSMIDSRFVAGDEGLWKRFISDGYQRIINKDKRGLVKGLFNEVNRRYKTYSPSLYQLEPNIKEGRGGLRDIHTILWLCRVTQGTSSLEGLRGILSSSEYRQFKRAYEFVLRSRLYLHIVSQSKNEVLSFQYQEALAAAMGYKRTRSFSASEIFMRVYYRHTRTIMESLKKVITLTDQRVFQHFPQIFTRRLTKDFSLSRGEIILNKGVRLDRPALLLEAFEAYQASGRPFSVNLQRELIRRQTLIRRGKPPCPESVMIFKRILNGRRVYETLSEMHRLNILDRLIADFGRLRHLVIHEPYHRYTVDEHTLRAIRHLELVIEGKQQRYPLLHMVSRELSRRVLYLALLLHDIGKGYYGETLKHDEEGYKRLQKILEDLEIESSERRLIKFLVKNHLLLSKSALKRETEAPETILWLAEQVESEKNLKALLLITYADMSAVNPDFFSDWKAQMLFELYMRTMEHLQGVTRKLDHSEELQAFLSLMPEVYVVATTPEEMKRDSEVFYRAMREGPTVDICRKVGGTAEIVLAALDAKCLFLKVLEQIGRYGLNILKARLYPAKNDMVLDKITLSNWDSLEWAALKETLKRDITNAILSETKVLEGITTDNYKDQLHGRGRGLPVHLTRFEPFVKIDNLSSNTYSIVEVFAADRIGLLYDIATIFSLFDIDIVSAIINTEDRVAHDVFYVQYKGKQIDGEGAIGLKEALRYISGEVRK